MDKLWFRRKKNKNRLGEKRRESISRGKWDKFGGEMGIYMRKAGILGENGETF